ncbi:Glycerol:H+ symporter [Ectocarpus siliculosus]|uniref:Glycerol:H+ symporter n=1 Tax=Ectocarpus siliculosus TaxID=2880 RepID=D7FSC7_ECTSI|nr:Glycerol:H+ symporter [Ectocarpus siliculosus]|eukprot:CBJ31068.1 Glycerol:H+ symporter [Ectocarpus siliculosus]
MANSWRLGRVLELAGYVVFFGISLWHIPNVCSPMWLKECMDKRSCGRFLRQGWLGQTLDGADDQWRELRDSLPLLFAAIAAHGLLSLLVRKTCPQEGAQQVMQKAGMTNTQTKINTCTSIAADKSDAAANAPATSPQPAFLPMGKLGRRRALLNAAVSVVFLAVLHGAPAVFPVALLCGAFWVGHALKGTRLALPAIWVIAVVYIWLKEKWYGLLTFEAVLGKGFAGLDGLQGLHPWRLSFNLVVLRIVSFNVDLHWAEVQRRRQGSSAGAPMDSDDKRLERKEIDVHDYSSRVSAHRPLAEYSLGHCLCYAFYAPLYLAGPTVTFNAFVSHMACPQKSYGRSRMLFYLARFVFALLLLEWSVHNLPVFALARSGSLNFSPTILGLFAYTILLIMWLKFLVIWRLFRFWALCDGVEPPENMQRCMTNNYSVVGFWKGWHCSFNRWLVRYIFIPLGGSKPGRRWNVFVVFVFVAFWHDVEPKLFLWGLLNGVFLVLETTIKGLYRNSTALESCRANPLSNRMIEALGATSNVMALILVNMIGYAVGIKGAGHVAGGIFLEREALIAVALSFMFVFSGVQLMFFIEEARQGGKKKLNEPAHSYKKIDKS